MIHELYLQPPTFAEFIYVVHANVYGPKEAYERFILNTYVNQLYGRQFKFPESINIDDLTNKKLEQLFKSFSFTNEHMPRIDASSNVGRLSLQLFEYLSPQTTLNNQSGDCKSFAVFAVTGKRLLERPSRFYVSNNNHMLIEELHDGHWTPKEPREFSSYSPLNFDDPMHRLFLELRHGIIERDSKFDYYYDLLPMELSRARKGSLVD